MRACLCLGVAYILYCRDYRGATAAGLEARLLRREGGWSDGARRDKHEQLDDVETIRGLEEIVAEARRRQ
jgi:hypothetical protein